MPVAEVIIRDEFSAQLEAIKRSLGGLGSSASTVGVRREFKAAEEAAYRVGREFGSLLRITGITGALVGGGFVATIAGITRALGDFSRARLGLHYTAQELGTTTQAYERMVARGRALGMSTEQASSAITSMVTAMRDLRSRGVYSDIWQQLGQVGGPSGIRFAHQFRQALSGPEGFEGGMRWLAERMRKWEREGNTQALSAVRRAFNMGTIGWKDILDLGPIDDIVETDVKLMQRFLLAQANLSTAMQNIRNTVALAVIPAFTRLTSALTDWLRSKAGENFLTMLRSWAEALEKANWEEFSRRMAEFFAAVKQVWQDIWPYLKATDDFFRQMGTWGTVVELAAVAGLVTWLGGVTAGMLALAGFAFLIPILRGVAALAEEKVPLPRPRPPGIPGDIEASGQTRRAPIETLGRSIDAFRTGGLYGVAREFGFEGPTWMRGLSRFFRNPDVTTAMGSLNPLAAPGAIPPGALMKEMPVDAAAAVIDWRRRSGIREHGAPQYFSEIRLNRELDEVVSETTLEFRRLNDYVEDLSWETGGAWGAGGPGSFRRMILGGGVSGGRGGGFGGGGATGGWPGGGAPGKWGPAIGGDTGLGPGGGAGAEPGGRGVVSGVDPELVATVEEGAKFGLPEGYTWKWISGARVGGRAGSYHHRGMAPGGMAGAGDIQIYDDKGRPIANVGTGPGYHVYERFALSVRAAAERRNFPFTWGGHFRSGVPFDLMHMQRGGPSAAGFDQKRVEQEKARQLSIMEGGGIAKSLANERSFSTRARMGLRVNVRAPRGAADVDVNGDGAFKGNTAVSRDMTPAMEE